MATGKPFYISDLDGTLLGPRGTLSEHARAELSAMLREGLPFTIATARSIHSVALLFAGVPLRLPVIEHNGSMITDPLTGERLVAHTLAREIIEDVHELAVATGCLPFVAALVEGKDRLYCQATTNPGEDWYREILETGHDVRLRRVADLRETYGGRIVALTVIEREPAVRELEARVNERWGGRAQTHIFENLYSPGWFWLNVHDRHATKERAIVDLLELLGCGAEDLVVFGDEANDVGMFKLAGRAVAPDNAIPAVREQATETIGHCGLDSVVNWLREDWTARRPG